MPKGKILIVEDDKDLAHMLTYNLRRNRHPSGRQWPRDTGKRKEKHF